MMRLRSFFALPAVSLAALAATALTAPSAHANGRFPQANALYPSPTASDEFVMQATFGFLFSKDATKTWGYACEQSVGIGLRTIEDPTVAMMKGRTLAGTNEGLYATIDGGCTWTGIDKHFVVDLVQRPDAPGTVLELYSDSLPVDGPISYDTEVLQSTDDGATFTKLGVSIDETLIAQTIEVAKSDPNRIYVSAFKYRTDDSGIADGYVLVSTDKGATYATYKVPLVEGQEEVPYISAVDPNDANVLYVRTGLRSSSSRMPKQGSQWTPPVAGRLLVSKDGGKTYASIYSGTNLLTGFALTPDGSKVYVGGPSDGVWVASKADYKFTQTSTIHAVCLRGVADGLYACSDATSGFLLGKSTDDGKTFASVVHLQCIDTLLACPATSTVNVVCTKSDYTGQTPFQAVFDTNTYNTDRSICTGTGGDKPGVDAGTGVDGGAARPDGGITTEEDAGTGDVDAGRTGGGDSGGCSLSVAAPLTLGTVAGNVALLGTVAAFVARRRRRSCPRS